MSRVIELNTIDFNSIIRGEKSRSVLIESKASISFQWHAEIKIKDLRIMRHLIDVAINEQLKERIDCVLQRAIYFMDLN